MSDSTATVEPAGHISSGARGTARIAFPAPRAVPQAHEDPYKYKYIIAIAVTLAAVLELIDTSIVNVAIPHMMGNLGATLDEI
jgi:DHA2 family multidrug resistance protein